MKIGRKIRVLREIIGYSQEYMSIQLEISQATYSRIETETSKIDIDRLNQITKILDIDIISLLIFNKDSIDNLKVLSFGSTYKCKWEKYEDFESRLTKLELEINLIRKLIRITNT